MALHGVNVGVVSGYSYDLTGMQQQQQQSGCGPTAARASTATRRPSGLLLVNAALTLAVNVWLCGMTCV